MSNFSTQTQTLRKKIGLTMQELADRANVSKSTICKIESDCVQPTLDVAARIAVALGTTLSKMLHANETMSAVFLPSNQQSSWVDPVSHIQRRVIAPPFVYSNLEWLYIKIPSHVSSGRLPALMRGSEKCVYLLTGELIITVGTQTYHLKAGDSLYFSATASHEYSNPTKKTVECFCINRMV